MLQTRSVSSCSCEVFISPMRDIILPPIDISHEDFKDKKSIDNNHSLLERVCAAFEDLSLHDHGISHQDVMAILHDLNSEKSYINQKPLIMARTMYFDLWLMVNADKLATRDLTLEDLEPFVDRCISNFKGIISVLSPVKYFSSIQKEFTSNESLCHGILEVIFAALKDFIKPTSKIHWKDKIEPYYLLKVFRIFSRVERWVVKLGQAPYEVIHLLNDAIRKVENVSPEIITECAAVLANCTSAPSNRKDMLSTGSLDLIISKFTELSKHADMHNAMACCTEICAALSNFALFDKSASIIVDCGVLDTINSLCISYRKNAALISQACHLFTNISKHLKDKSKVDEFLSIVVNAFYDHQFDEKVILPAINALGSFAFSGVSFSGFKEDLTAFLLKSMDVFDYDTSTQLAALFSISHLAHGDCISIPTFNKCKGMDKIIRAMKQYECFPTVQTAACFAIGTLIRTDKDCRKSLLESNGISLILKAMTKRSLLPEKKENSVVKRVVTAFNVTTPNAQRQNARVSNSVFTTDLMESSSADDLHAVPSNESINTSQRVNGMSRGNSEVSLTDNPPQISNEVGTQEIKPKKLEKDHLILMFACVCLMNLADDEACKKECMRLGAIHYVFIAIKKISEQHSHDLMIVLYTVLNKFFPTGIPCL